MLSPTLSIIILIEVIATLVIAYGIYNEEKLIKFEDKIIKKILRK